MPFYRLLSVSIGLTLCLSAMPYTYDNQGDTTMLVSSVLRDGVSDSIYSGVDESIQLFVNNYANQVSTESMPIETRLDSSKKNITVVNNGNESNLSTVIDTNPLLTAIRMYDPWMNRVWLQEPKTFYDENLIDYIRLKPLFLPLVFSLYSPDFSLRNIREINEAGLLKTPAYESLMVFLQREHEKLQFDLEVLRHVESNLIRYVDYRKTDLPDANPLVFILKGERPMFLEKPSELLMKQVEKKEYNYVGVEYNPWIKRGNIKLNFSETFLSSNWSKGGESNMAGMATLFLEANYNNLKTIQFDNSLEVKIGLNTVSTDTLRNLNVSSDQLRGLSKLGIKMRDNWYYSLSSEFVTQTLNNYRKNTMNLLSSFMSPAKLFISLGVDFKKNDKKKGYNLSVMISPLTYKANYLYDNVNLKPKSYGIDPGKHFGSEIGSKISSNITWKLSDRLNWKSKIYYFSDYTYVDSEWENTFDISLNNYFSTQFYLYAKMDDRLKRKPGESLIQVQQLLSFGMTYRF